MEHKYFSECVYPKRAGKIANKYSGMDADDSRAFAAWYLAERVYYGVNPDITAEMIYNWSIQQGADIANDIEMYMHYSGNLLEDVKNNVDNVRERIVSASIFAARHDEWEENFLSPENDGQGKHAIEVDYSERPDSELEAYATEYKTTVEKIKAYMKQEEEEEKARYRAQ